ncbi:dipeptidyl aminopeptidase/acylaminoacyl peptidase [Bacillus pakistanensis]|uniref:Dipeptidyl aminopeptidase/acylaminoacyl peptidase n=1 Tax=Rossellomorea pakistanensis TaxID=992288 RepID=A0ABS2NF45_9BACI|nr:S9 family peptidase [Bacillus pakistanensis]MBM7586464.1 dipeptidyl aminopeptidase/acylaminoacyl peptidase [Bacillus pakistanensis]
MSSRKEITAEDLLKLKSVADPRLAPNGKEAVYVQTNIDEEKNDYFSHLYHLNIETGSISQWTFGEYRNKSPRWSPNGKQVAFVSNRLDKNQIFILSKDGGEARQITDCENGATNPVWSPCGTKIAFSSSIDLNEKEKPDETKEVLKPLEVVRMKYKSDDHGFLDGKKNHIFVVDIETGEHSRLTDEQRNYQLQGWSPDGKFITYTGDEQEDNDFSFKSDVFLLHSITGEKKRITNGGGWFGQVTWSPNSQYITYIGHEREFENATLSKLWLYNVEEETIMCMTNELDMPVGDYMVIDFQQGVGNPGVIWSQDNQSFYFLATDHGNTVLYYGNLDGEMYPALLDDQYVYGYDLDSNSQKILLAISRPTEPGDLYYLDVPTGDLQRLTDVNNEILQEKQLSQPEAFEFEGAEGLLVHGWLMRPTAFEEGRKYGLIVDIHGGPHAMYGNTYFHEFQMLASSGYAVLYINPRGSHGYGQQFVNAVRGDYGGNDYRDIMDAVDYVLKKYDFIDEEKLGVTGGSYGGFMTNWIVGHTDRFKAAVTQRSICNWVSFYGVSDIGYYFSEWQIQSDLGDVEKLWKHSPLAYVGKIDTPLLIIHSEKDYRCPIEQAEQLYIALKRKKKETKFIRFPESNHNLSRNGKPNLRVERLNYIKNWFNEYL